MALITPTFPRVVDAALLLCVDFGADDEEEAEARSAVAERVVVDALEALTEGDATADVATPLDALVTPLTCAWTLGLKLPDMPARLAERHCRLETTRCRHTTYVNLAENA